MAYTKAAEPTVAELAQGWVKHFYSSDVAITWGAIEQEKSLWLDDQTLLLGKIDAQGQTEDGDHFFADWKTISGRKKNYMDQEKADYRLDPQMLTYGVLCAERPEQARFMVRWAMKSGPPLYFHEWYRYSPAEIEWWRSELIRIAAKIREDKALTHFVPNLTNCRKYNQLCPFYLEGCAKQNWSARPEGLIDRVSHLQTERDYLASSNRQGVVILDATRTDTWLTCNEQYRKKYVEGLVEPVTPGGPLDTGLQFHELMAAYYNKSEK